MSSFNHKTGAEDVHFTSLSSQDEFDHELDDGHGNDECEDMLNDKSAVEDLPEGKGSFCGSDLECSSTSVDDPTILLMIMVKDVKAGSEVRHLSKLHFLYFLKKLRIICLLFIIAVFLSLINIHIFV